MSAPRVIYTIHELRLDFIRRFSKYLTTDEEARLIQLMESEITDAEIEAENRGGPPLFGKNPACLHGFHHPSFCTCEGLSDLHNYHDIVEMFVRLSPLQTK